MYHDLGHFTCTCMLDSIYLMTLKLLKSRIFGVKSEGAENRKKSANLNNFGTKTFLVFYYENAYPHLMFCSQIRKL